MQSQPIKISLEHGRANPDPLLAHSLALEEGRLVPTVDFNFAILDGESDCKISIPLSQAASALSRILDWLGQSYDFSFAGAKAAALAALLGSANSPYRNLSQIARAAGISRATLSKAVLRLRDDGIRLADGKMNSSRQIYRQTQLELVKAGSLSESAATKELIKIRALADVLRARAKAAELSLSLARSFAEVLHA